MPGTEGHVMTTEQCGKPTLVECVCGWRVFTVADLAQTEIDAHLAFHAEATA